MTRQQQPKRYLAVIWPRSKGLLAAMIAGYERDGKVFQNKKLIGFAVDYYPEESLSYKREFGKAIIGDFANRSEAETAIADRLR